MASSRHDDTKLNTMVSLTSDAMMKNLTGTTVKLNGNNYAIWAQSFRVFLRAQRKLKYITDIPPDPADAAYDDWMANDSCVIGWLLNSMNDTVTPGVVFLNTAKEIWDALKEMYGNEKNISRVYELYENFFALQQGDHTVTDLYSSLRAILDELDIHQPLVLDLQKLREYREGLAVAKFLSALRPEVSNQIRGQVLGADSIPSLSSTFSRALRVSTGASSISSDYSAMAASTRGRGRGRGRDSGGGRGGGRFVSSDKGPRRCEHCGRTNHISEKCWDKFGKPEWANMMSVESTSDTVS